MSSTPRRTPARRKTLCGLQWGFNRYPALMWVILLEALAALLLLVFIVWWTMFSGRRGGERSAEPTNESQQPESPDYDSKPPTGLR